MNLTLSSKALWTWRHWLRKGCSNRGTWHSVRLWLSTSILAVSGLLPHASAQEKGPARTAGLTELYALMFLQPVANPLEFLKFGKFGFIDHSGKLTVKPIYFGAGNFAANGLAPVEVDPLTQGSRDRERWGYIDARGAMVIPARFKGASEFGENGLAAVRRDDGSWDFIDASGEFKTSAHFLQLDSYEEKHGAMEPVAFSRGLSPAESRSGQWGYIGTAGHWVIRPRYDDASPFSRDSWAVVSQKHKSGYINTRGESVIPPSFEKAALFSRNGLAAVQREGKWGFISRSGATAIAPIYELVGQFAQNYLARAYLDGKCGYIDVHGKWAIRRRFSMCFAFGDGSPDSYARVIEGDFAGLIDDKGRFVFKPFPTNENGWGEFSANGLMAYSEVSSGSRLWGYIDIRGRFVIRPQFLFAGSFGVHGLARVVNRGLKTGYVNAKGEFGVPPDLDCADDFAPDGLARGLLHGQWGFFDRSGKMVVKSQYAPITDFSSSGYAQVSDRETRPVEGQCWFDR